MHYAENSEFRSSRLKRHLKEALYSSIVVSDRRLRVYIAHLREMVEEDEIQVEWIEKRKQLADCMTKKVASSVEFLEVLSTSKL